MLIPFNVLLFCGFLAPRLHGVVLVTPGDVGIQLCKVTRERLLKVTSVVLGMAHVKPAHRPSVRNHFFDSGEPLT